MIFHNPGPAWNAAMSPLDQTGVMEHVAYLRQLADKGTLQASGPFIAGGNGGMILTRLGTTEEEAAAIGREDPGVRSGLITFEVKAWMVTIGAL